MSGEHWECQSSEIYYKDMILSSENILERYYHSIARVVRPHLFYSWLRAKSVLKQSDQEEIEHGFLTTVLKAGKLSD